MTRQVGELLTDVDRRKKIFKEGCTPASREKWAQMCRAGVFWSDASLGGVQRFLHKRVQKFIPVKSRIPVCYMQYHHRLANVFSSRFVWFWVKLKNISFWLKQLHWNICSLQLLEGLPEAEKAFAVLLTSSVGSLPEICKLNPRWYRYLCQKTRTACFAISAFNFLLITCSVLPKRRNVLIYHSCLCSHALFGQNQESKGHSSFFPGAQRWDAEDHHNWGGVDQKQGGTHSGPRGPALRCVPTWASCVNSQQRRDWAVCSDNGKTVRGISLARNHDWSHQEKQQNNCCWLTEGEGSAAALRWPGKRSRVCKLDFPQLHLTAPAELQRKTLRGAGGCAWGEFSTPSCPLVAVNSVTHQPDWAGRGRETVVQEHHHRKL